MGLQCSCRGATREHWNISLGTVTTIYNFLQYNCRSHCNRLSAAPAPRIGKLCILLLSQAPQWRAQGLLHSSHRRDVQLQCRRSRSMRALLNFHGLRPNQDHPPHDSPLRCQCAARPHLQAPARRLYQPPSQEKGVLGKPICPGKETQRMYHIPATWSYPVEMDGRAHPCRLGTTMSPMVLCGGVSP